MIYLNHDFYSNFSAGTNAEGNNLTIDLFANELSDLIVYETPKLIDSVSKVGVNVKESMSDEEIVDNILSDMSKDDKVIKAISFAIAESNGLINDKKGDKIDWVKAIDTIVLGLTPASKEITQSKETQSVTKQRVMKQIETKAKSKGNYTRQIWKSKSYAKPIFIIGGLLALGIAGYFIYRGVKKGNMAAPAPLMLGNG